MHLDGHGRTVSTDVVRCVLEELTASPGHGECRIVDPTTPPPAFVPKPSPVHAPPPLQQRGLHGRGVHVHEGRSTAKHHSLRNNGPPFSYKEYGWVHNCCGRSRRIGDTVDVWEEGT
ncbi:unnamed protein product [Macrosiphum euphorbiae]|uniref:Uncharacterized protein n=1 Tax=Macrosiphum euphorbiae TaxID=13131 RepID=A0AAV0Y3C4_9HEMI|nr:unnamed protein product [Macrosiphum euphorbiae]